MSTFYATFLIVFAFCLGFAAANYHSPQPPQEAEPTSLIKEIEDCRAKGGEFWIHPNYSSSNFPDYWMYCEKTTSERLFEYSPKSP